MHLTATFPDEPAASRAAAALAADGLRCEASPETDLSHHETRFIGRIVIIIALASVVGTALGVGMGVLISFAIGPHGTSGIIIEAVSWAIFAHLLIGMWAGYWLLADRTHADLPIPGHRGVILSFECASIDADALASRLRKLGATDVSISDAAPQAAQ